jgi:hypothetical protein
MVGDGKTDQAFYRPETGVWFVKPSGGGSYYGEYFGAAASDILVPGDYDGDGKTDYGFYQPSTGIWYIKPSGEVPSWYAVYFGGSGLASREWLLVYPSIFGSRSNFNSVGGSFG